MKTACGSCAEGGHVKQVGRHLYNSHLLMKMRRYGLLAQDHHRADVVHCQQVFSGAPLHTMEREKKNKAQHTISPKILNSHSNVPRQMARGRIE